MRFSYDASASEQSATMSDAETVAGLQKKKKSTATKTTPDETKPLARVHELGWTRKARG